MKPDPQEETKEETKADVKPIPTTVHREKKAPKVSVTLPLALQRIHEKLSHPTELLKLHLKHYHMSTEQFKKRTSALKIPAKIYEEYEKVVKQCDTCQKSKIETFKIKNLRYEKRILLTMANLLSTRSLNFFS